MSAELDVELASMLETHPDVIEFDTRTTETFQAVILAEAETYSQGWEKNWLEKQAAIDERNIERNT